MWNWNKVFSDNEFEYLLKVKDGKKYTNEQYQLAMDVLMDDFIHAYGLNTQYKKMLDLKKRSAKLKLQYLKKQLNDMAALMLINRIDALDKDIMNLKKLFLSGEKNDFDKMVVMIQKWYGQKIDLKNTTVKEFHAIKEMYVAANKKG
jgi:hypothetical protein